MQFLGGETRRSGGFRLSVGVQVLGDGDKWDTLGPLDRRKIAICSCDNRGGVSAVVFKRGKNDHSLYVGLEIAYVVEFANVVAIHCGAMV
jgi:hypothetical protein